jgi:hypothetical protein
MLVLLANEVGIEEMILKNGGKIQNGRQIINNSESV